MACVLDDECRLAGDGRVCDGKVKRESFWACEDAGYLALARLDAKLFDGKTLPVKGVPAADDSVDI